MTWRFTIAVGVAALALGATVGAATASADPLSPPRNRPPVVDTHPDPQPSQSPSADEQPPAVDGPVGPALILTSGATMTPTADPGCPNCFT